MTKQETQKKTTKPHKWLISPDEPFLLSVVGRKNSGKSQLVSRYLRDPEAFKSRFDKIIFISPTFTLQATWSGLKGNIHVYPEISTELLDHIISEQSNNRDVRTLVVIDDIGDALRKTIDTTTANRFVSNSRHINVSIICLVQCLMYLPPPFRSQTDMWVFFGSCSRKEVDKLWADVAVCKREVFDVMFHQATKEPFSWLSILVRKGGKVEFWCSEHKQIVY